MTRILVFSDVHGNLTALEAVLAHAGPVDGYWCLGDLVGYGPDPQACVERVRSLPNLVCLMGNHDAAVVGRLDLTWFNTAARTALLWTREQLSEDALNFLAGNPPQVVLKEYDVTLVHGSLRAPLEEYLLSPEQARASIERLETTWGCFGHTHIPLAYVREQDGQVARWVPEGDGATCTVPQGSLFNPGSVGQPRDGDPRAAYAIFEPETQRWTWHRVEYDVHAVQEKILAAGLPRKHALRLAYGW